MSREGKKSGGSKAVRTAAAIGRAGAIGVSSVIFLALKIVGTVLLILVTAALLFACSFTIYMKT
ncbi:MAG: hypothetical protein IK136_01075, partial [Oscillospiraceae bacterium]|nr:hypothetical protein [Oscillospiraceae bacterium]